MRERETTDTTTRRETPPVKPPRFVDAHARVTSRPSLAACRTKDTQNARHTKQQHTRKNVRLIPHIPAQYDTHIVYTTMQENPRTHVV